MTLTRWRWKGALSAPPGERVPEKFVIGGAILLVFGLLFLGGILFLGFGRSGGDVDVWIYSTSIVLGVLVILAGVVAHRRPAKTP